MVVLCCVGLGWGCEIHSPSLYDITSIPYSFVYSALFQTIFQRRGYNLHNLYRIKFQIMKLRQLFETLETFYWRWSFHNSSYGQPLISIVTGWTNCTVNVKSIFIMIVNSVWPPLQSHAWRMSRLQVRFCFICLLMCWYLRMRKISVLGIP